jgi:hypothetical protein
MIIRKSAIQTKSEKMAQQRQLPPVITAHAAKSVSPQRKEMLRDEIDQGLYREEGSGVGYTFGSGRTAAGNVTMMSTPIKKTAQTSPGSGSPTTLGPSGYRGNGGTVRQIPEIYPPLWLTSNLNLPRDRATINAWSRAFFALNPVVRNAILLHSTYPISKMEIKCENKEVQDFFNNMAEEIELENICVQVAQEYWGLGESFIYAQLDEIHKKWSRLIIQNPDYIQVQHSISAGEPMISLRPDENLKRIVNSPKPSDVQQRKFLDPNIINYVKKGENIPLNNFYVSHLAMNLSPYDMRGTGLITSCFRQLMLFDIMREAKFHQAYNLINPITLIKVGNENYKPAPADLEYWRELFENAQNDKDFKIISHEGVTIERIGAQGGIIDISGDITQLLKEIYIGLLIPQVIMDGGGDVTYANGGVTLDVLRQRYFSFRNLLTLWLRRKIFAPISKLNGFYEKEGGVNKLIVPQVSFSRMSLFDTNDYIQSLMQLSKPSGEGGQKDVSRKTLFVSLGLDFEEEKRNVKQEMIDEIIAEKEKAALSAMSLDELKTLTVDSDIKEAPGQPLPGEEGAPGEEGGGGLPGMDLGGLGAPPQMPSGGGVGGGETSPAPAPKPAAAPTPPAGK